LRFLHNLGDVVKEMGIEPWLGKEKGTDETVETALAEKARLESGGYGDKTNGGLLGELSGFSFWR